MSYPYGAIKRRKPATIEAWKNADKIVGEYLDGKWCPELAKQYGVAVKSIFDILESKGIPRRQKDQYRTHSVNTEYFAQIDSAEKAQILGFIYADGCIAENAGSLKLIITIHQNDYSYLRKIADAIGYTGPVRKHSRRGRDHCTLVVHGRKFCEHLVRLGVTPRKSHTLQFPSPEQVPTYLLPAFLLGFFEGDGSINNRTVRKQRKTHVWTKIYTRVSFSAPRQFADEMKSYLEGYGIHSGITPDRSIWQVEIWRADSVKRLLALIYNNATFFMERKHERYTNYLKAA